ncbi:TetR/AcrR family transcriptional regulator C-terminal domain-containing protein [Arthrobacter ginkgonis]|uniref:TetR/AcrR family transcriptional regulator C-terminal domain-containing protein n=1 Tax=Arthrobacter ginkgonis TaxID=1630594 RepID=A0ABP7C369_9MICC
MGRPKAPLLSREQVVAAALELVDAEGDFSFPKLAKSLGVSQSSIYHHVSGRAELVEMLRGAAFRAGDDSPSPNAPWHEKLRDAIRLYRAGFAQHPRLAPLLASTTVENPHILGMYEGIAAALAEAGFRGPDIVSAIGLVDSFAIGAALDLSAPDVPWRPSRGSYPALEEALAQAAPPVQRAEAAFEFGLETLIAGLRARAQQIEQAGRITQKAEAGTNP